MYSKNDYRYYLERQCMESDDFLMHYGVKGMKWKKHKYAGVSGWLSAKGHNAYLGRGAKSKTFTIGNTTVSVGTNRRNGRSALTVGRKGKPTKSFTYDSKKTKKNIRRKTKKAANNLKWAVSNAKHEINKYRGAKRVKTHTDALKKELRKSAKFQGKSIKNVRKKVTKPYSKQANIAKRKARKAYGLNKRDFQRPAKRAEMKKSISKKLGKSNRR